ncbi:hypothetical protein SAMN04515647_3730 [Cohaesibacter sp. ES.047]|uniref:hypothetical protein n=1 Tax=Cohaesibacter sp. ES.047 TaxID=1798205 RepID=UPI000BB7312C|nr:hypothetical protein [Cohaesibacter sp. ES.047]SNY93435.1 hypothetical protein SAMN04515647_3730 [Cohaesibacter sp. ES.047]
MTPRLVADPKPEDIFTSMESAFVDFEQYLDVLFDACCDMPPNAPANKVATAMQMAMNDRLRLARQQLDHFKTEGRRMAS